MGGVVRSSRTYVSRGDLSAWTIVLTSQVGSGRSRVDSNGVVRNSCYGIETDGVPQKVAVGQGNGKNRDRRGGVNSSVIDEQKGDAAPDLTVCGYLRKQRRRAKIAG